MRATLSLFLTTTLFSGCTHWGTKTVYGQKYEVERRLLGEPSLATTSSSSMSAGFAGASSSRERGGRRDGVLVAGLEGGSDSITRTHCVQQAEIHYEQPVELQPEPKGRIADVAGGVLLGFLGLSVIMASKVRSSTVFEPGDPFYEEPPSAAPGYLVGTAMIGGGIGLIAYSFGKLPKGPKPQTQYSKRRLVQTELVEATGCTTPTNVAAVPVTKAPAAASATDPTSQRLQKLDELREAGTITEAEYQKKRKQIIDQL